MSQKITSGLPLGTVLHGQIYDYEVGEVLGQGSFGITYLAQVRLRGQLGSIGSTACVAIKEFFMKDINGREKTAVTSGSKGGVYYGYRRKFAREAKSLGGLDHPNIVKVLESFEANNTVYYVMEYIDGGSLNDHIEQSHGLPEAESLKCFREISSALSYMHDHKMLHLDLKPSNIMLRKNGECVLIDFGLSKQYDEWGNAETSTSIGGGTPGYAPIEQINYNEGNGFPVTMDVYALGATLFKMLTGVRPPEASVLLNDGFPTEKLSMRKVSEPMINAIQKAMSLQKKYRYQNVKDFLSDVDDISSLHENRLTAPDAGVYISLRNPKPGSLSYDFFLNEGVCNTVFVYKDNEKILDTDWSGGIPQDVMDYFDKNGFLLKDHWENEDSTLVSSEGIKVECQFAYRDGSLYKRSVYPASYDGHAKLLNAVEGLVRETCLNEWIIMAEESCKKEQKQKVQEETVVAEKRDVVQEHTPQEVGCLSWFLPSFGWLVIILLIIGLDESISAFLVFPLSSLCLFFAIRLSKVSEKKASVRILMMFYAFFIFASIMGIFGYYNK